MYDVAITGGLVVDGSGAPGVHADVAIRDGRVVAVGALDEPAARTIEADGRVVAPGFIDVHTHYDAQAFWDGSLSPSPLHGITTAIGGNCGFTIAPLSEHDGEYLMRMLARVEGMPLETLQAGVPWDWRTTAEYYDRLRGRVAPNVGFLVGHSALRHVVMRDDATQRAATPEEVARMADLLEEGLRAGGLGFSSTWSTSHNDHHGNPVPSRCSTRDEVLALCAAVGRHAGTTLEFIPQVGPLTEQSMDLMTAMSVAANRPINWNFIQVYAQNRELVDHQLSAGDYAASRGGRIVGLTLPDSFRMRLNFASGFVLDILPGWDKLMALPLADKKAMLADPAGRAEMDRLAQSQEGNLRALANWGGYVLVETRSERFRPFIGQSFAEIARALNTTAWDALCDVAVLDDLTTSFTNPDRGQDDASWERRVEVWRDHRALPGASDAGAHVDMIDSFAATTLMLGQAVRRRSLLPIEEAVHYFTGAPAALYGLVDRGTLAVGAHADVVVLDADRVGCGPVHTRQDLPAGGVRLYAEADGIDHVLVAGVEIASGGVLTDARPGSLLRSGTDTRTVTVS